jgi:hypothetical protein
MENWWNDTDKVKPQHAEKTLSLRQLNHHKSHIE